MHALIPLHLTHRVAQRLARAANLLGPGRLTRRGLSLASEQEQPVNGSGGELHEADDQRAPQGQQG